MKTLLAVAALLSGCALIPSGSAVPGQIVDAGIGTAAVCATVFPNELYVIIESTSDWEYFIFVDGELEKHGTGSLFFEFTTFHTESLFDACIYVVASDPDAPVAIQVSSPCIRPCLNPPI